MMLKAYCYSLFIAGIFYLMGIFLDQFLYDSSFVFLWLNYFSILCFLCSWLIFSFLLRKILLQKKGNKIIRSLIIFICFMMVCFWYYFVRINTILIAPNLKQIYFIAEKSLYIYQYNRGNSRQDYLPCELGSDIYYKLPYIPFMFYLSHIPFREFDSIQYESNKIIFNSSECPRIIQSKILEL